MCGIAGILVAACRDPKSLEAIGEMTRSLRHRGPDGEGLWTDRDAGIALGHRRLAIVDLSGAGRQPMRSASARYVISFNGEIYNFRDLRRELEAAGHQFHSTGDTEVMLVAIETWGLEAALKRFAGMFAFALWDLKTRTLHLARDRMGKKPLYVALAGHALLFASELKAIRRFPLFCPELDLDAAGSMLSKGWVPDHKCIWRGVFKLPPGSLLSIRSTDLAEAGSAVSLCQRVDHWWSLAEVAAKGLERPILGSDDELTDELDELLRLAVRERMVADVPLGGFLSGGIDSSTVVALMQAQSRSPVRTFTIAFAEGGFDEAPYAAEVARHLGTDHTELHLSPDAAREVIPELPRIWDEPFADESQIPTLLVARLARQHVTVALSGDGGDECFAGYGRHFMANRLKRQQSLPLMVRRTMASGLSLLARVAREDFLRGLPLAANVRHMLRSDRLDRLAGLLTARHEDELYQRLVTSPAARLTRHSQSGSIDSAPKLDGLLSRLLYDDMAGYLPGDILVKLDRATMANGLEGRCPLLDHRVVEFAWRLPSEAKVRNGSGKWILRNLLRRYLPDRLIDRPKQGFDVPVAAWLRGPLRNWATDLLADMRRDGENVLDSTRVQGCWLDHMRGQDRSRELWSAFMFQAWLNEARREKVPIDPSRTLDMAGV
ncbi:asparagine synthase (glutamine-hydrolyzing) [Mesorhizobium sp.]|uniref:asparagine synthase (glutamine-hydrolyzing) n=1 Tax=Mesorhizobium sp. TaxID=1871066 RepID=UPI000FE86EB9|nr:asparagine synthase (glutamine-hydrolyzing) [Mesorhizobium sp.]RWB67634.1 MAG: asparagine synthase (glutamine-hydrolyzing) [Mesorhizobium sp.]RWB84027.1 MAG: asparagine synthase (glutamine-hydrolyzing) [Mesorhizobium sp.]